MKTFRPFEVHPVEITTGTCDFSVPAGFSHCHYYGSGGGGGSSGYMMTSWIDRPSEPDYLRCAYCGRTGLRIGNCDGCGAPK